MSNIGIIVMTMAVFIAIFFVGVPTGKKIEEQQTIQKICSFTQPTLNDYTYCNGKSYDEVMFLLYRRLRNGN